jgi:hypothetical protein
MCQPQGGWRRNEERSDHYIKRQCCDIYLCISWLQLEQQKVARYMHKNKVQICSPFTLGTRWRYQQSSCYVKELGKEVRQLACSSVRPCWDGYDGTLLRIATDARVVETPYDSLDFCGGPYIHEAVVVCLRSDQSMNTRPRHIESSPKNYHINVYFCVDCFRNTANSREGLQAWQIEKMACDRFHTEKCSDFRDLTCRLLIY